MPLLSSPTVFLSRQRCLPFHSGNRQTTAQHTRNWQRAATCGNLWQSRLSTLFATRKLKFNLFLLAQLLDEMRALGRVGAR